MGIGVIIDAHSGLVMDYEVLSKSCQACAGMKTKLGRKKTTQEKYSQWKGKHECSLNFEGSSGAMEEKAATVIWQRSTEKQLHYTTYIGDGDCSAFKAVCQLNNGDGPYGPSKTVQKEECVNHVHKRMGTALRKVVMETTTEFQTKSGETRHRKLLGGRGKLTEDIIVKLSDYYGHAIKRNVGKTVDDMQKDIMSTYYHCTSTDQRPMHFWCP